jgi:hypothetical protein
MKAYDSFDAYLKDQLPRNQPLLRALRRFVKRAAPGLVEAVKWSNGCWIGRKEPVAYLYSAPDHVQFGFFRGSRLADPDALLHGSGQWVRHVKLRAASDIDEARLSALLDQAVALEGRLAAEKSKSAPARKTVRPRSRTTSKRPARG